jgi:hypothetical protein
MKKQIRRLAETTLALREGTSTYFSITRLTSLKSLCQDPQVAAQFTVYLAERTLERVSTNPCPEYTDPDDWERYQALIAQAVSLMRQHLHHPTEESEADLRAMWSAVEEVQSDTKVIRGSPIRLIRSQDVLVIEDALNCLLRPGEASYWAYQTARDYTEQYNPHYGTGLIPESVPMLEDILEFWERQEKP